MLGSCRFSGCGGNDYFWDPGELDNLSNLQYHDQETSRIILRYSWRLTTAMHEQYQKYWFCERCHRHLILIALLTALKKGDMSFECSLPRKLLDA